MDSHEYLNQESRRHYQQFLESARSALMQSFDDTLNHSRSSLIEQCYFKAISFPSWRKILSTKGKLKSQEIFDEMQSDLTASIVSAVFGNYKLALMSIRSFIELSNLFSYYYNHPIEYQWWLDGEHIIKFTDLQQNYFNKYSQLRSYKINENISIEWKKMSKYIHAEFKHMQSSSELPFLPVYQSSKLGQWLNHFNKATKYVNQFFYIVFKDLFFECFEKIEFDNPCRIIKHNLNDENLFLAVKTDLQNKA